MYAIYTSFTILCFLAIWHFMWKKALLDYTRDRLFDLRDELKEKFINNGYGLESKYYCELRNTLNRYIHNTEAPSLVDCLIFSLREKNKDSADKNLFDSRFITEDRELQHVIYYVRNKAALIFLSHMILRSMFATTLFVILVIFNLFIGLIKNMWLFFKGAISEHVFFKKSVFASIVIACLTTLPVLNGRNIEKYTYSKPPTTRYTPTWAG